MSITRITTGVNVTDRPSGYSIPALTPLTGVFSKERIQIVVAAVGVENAVLLTGFDALVAAVDTAVGTYITNVLKLDAAATITAHAFIEHVKRPPNVTTKLEAGEEIYSDAGTDEYLCTVNLEWQ